MSNNTVTIETEGLSNFGWELGIFCGLSCIVSGMVLQKIKGDFTRLESFFAMKDWELIENSKNVSIYSKIFKFMVIFMVCWPILSLITWGVSVIVTLAEQKKSALPGVSILLIGSCIILWVVGIMYVRFNNFKFTKFSLLCSLLGSMFFFSFQIVALLLEDELSFFGNSAVFLTANSMFMLFIVSMLYSKDGTTILEIIDNRDIIQRGASMSKDDQDDLNQLIKEERDNENYQPTDEEIFQLFTLVNEDSKGNEIFDVEKKLRLVKNTALGGGLQSIYKETSAKKKVLLILSFYLVSLGLLIAYSILGYNYGKETQKYLPLVTTIAVITTDIITIALIKLKLANGPIQITFLIILFRVLLFAFGGDLWFLGYCILYLFLGIFLNYHIVNRRYPFFEQHKATKFNIRKILTYPEFVQGIAFLIFAIATAVLEGNEFDRIPTKGFVIYGTRYRFFVFGIAAIFFNLISFCYLMSVRIYYRKMKGIQDFKVYYLFCKSFGVYYIYLLLTYILLVALGIIWYTLVDEFFFMFTCIFLPLIYECILIFYYNWQLNDYRVIADISEYNDKMNKYKEVRQKQQKKKMAYKIMIENKKNNVQDDKSFDQILKDIDQNGGLQEEQKESNREDIQIHLGGVSGDIMAVKGNLATYKDWKNDGLTFYEAFKTGKLLKSDYNTITAIAVGFLLMIIYSVCVAFTSDHWPLLGVTINVSILTILCIFMPLKQYFATLSKPNLQQIIILIFGLVVNFGWGAFYYFNKYEEDKKSGNDPQYYLTYFLFLLPWVISATAFYKKWVDNKFKMGIVEIILIVISALFALGMGLQFMYAKSIPAGAGILAFWFFVYYGWFLYWTYKRNNESLSKRLIILSLGIIIVICAISLILALILDEFNDFLGFSISYLVFNLLLFIYSYSQIQSDFLNQHKEPLFFSPWVYPIFKFNADKGRIEKRTRPFGLFMLSCLMFLVWAIAFSIWVQPVSIGTSLCNIALCFMFLVLITCSTWSQIKLGEVKQDINQEVVKSSWLMAKEQFLSHKNATSNNMVQTSLSLKKEAKNFKEQIVDMKKQYGNDKGVNYFLDLKDLYQDFYSLEQQEALAFQDEVRLLIEFQVIIVLKSAVFKRKQMKSFVKFINSWQGEIQSLGIIFQIQTKSKFLEVTYSSYMKQFESLSEEQQQAVLDLKKKYDQKQINEEQQDDVRDEEEEKKRIARQKELEQRMKEQQEDINLDQPLDQIPDCKEKYLKILQNYRQNKEKYVDASFPQDPSLLSDQSRDSCSKWERPPEGYSLIKGGYSPMDIRQGMLGNCYYLSALSVIGEENFRKCLLLDDEMFKDYEQERNECGAYICRFFYAGDEKYVIVDDFIPMMESQGKSRFLYAKSEDEGEIWPQIMEKAYAKFYGSFGNIEGGKVAYAVMELAGGQPEEIELKQFQDNFEQFWTDLVEYQKMGYILGAGSPAHAMGDSAISEEGIVQGHAYSVLRVADLDGNKLLYLRNPHGNRSAEWTGDWGDKSYLWNARLKQLANCQFEDDGCFWMSVEDFVYEYRALYVCRTFPENIWKTIPKITSGWIGKRAAGLPSKQNPDALMHENPHFGIKVYQKANVFISLTILEKDPENPKNGKYPIYFMCQRNDGQRIKGRSSDKMVGQSGMPITLPTVSTELALKASSYPYTFSLMCATMIKGGESPFILQIYSSDKKTEILGDDKIH